MVDDPLMFAINLTRTLNKDTYKTIEQVISPVNFLLAVQNRLYSKINQSAGSKYITYLSLNPHLKVHEIYNRIFKLDNIIPETYRVSFTRFRLSSHKLRIETGRWARLPREERLYKCGDIQDEKHVIMSCHITQDLRTKYKIYCEFHKIFNLAKKPDHFKFFHEILLCFEK